MIHVCEATSDGTEATIFMQHKDRQVQFKFTPGDQLLAVRYVDEKKRVQTLAFALNEIPQWHTATQWLLEGELMFAGANG